MSNIISYTLSMRIKDDENWPDSDEYANRSVSGTFLLDDSNPQRHILDIGRCGGEVRIEADFDFSRTTNGAVAIVGNLKLYEGTSENSGDLDGTESVNDSVAANRSTTLTKRVNNTAEGGDWADITLTVRNSFLAPTDACAHIDAKAQILGLSFTGLAESGCEAVRGGHRRRYQNCDIYYSPTTGAHEVHGEIRSKYNAKGGPDSDLLLPITDETPTPMPDTRGRYNHFSGNGSIYWHPHTGPMEVRGEIRRVWATRGWERSGLGYPTSDEMHIQQRPNQWFSDFQNGVLFWEESAEKEPATATLPRAKVLAALDSAFRRRVTDRRVDIQSVSIAGVSATGYDFWRSRNRSITFRITGEILSGSFLIPDPDWWVEMFLKLEATPMPNARQTVAVQIVKADTPRIHVEGIASRTIFNEISAAIDRNFSAPIKLADIPAEAGLLSVKVMPDGGIKLFFRPDPAGSFAAFTAQGALDRLEI